MDAGGGSDPTAMDMFDHDSDMVQLTSIALLVAGSALAAAFGFAGPTAGTSGSALVSIVASALSGAAATALIIRRLWLDRTLEARWRRMTGLVLFLLIMEMQILPDSFTTIIESAAHAYAIPLDYNRVLNAVLAVLVMGAALVSVTATNSELVRGRQFGPDNLAFNTFDIWAQRRLGAWWLPRVLIASAFAATLILWNKPGGLTSMTAGVCFIAAMSIIDSHRSRGNGEAPPNHAT